jgi:hypothetical protein
VSDVRAARKSNENNSNFSMWRTPCASGAFSIYAAFLWFGSHDITKTLVVQCISMDVEQLRQFLVDSNKAGFAGGEEKKWIKEPDGSTTIPFEKGEWRSHDNFFGGEPYGGRVVVFYQNKPVWVMVYYGWIEPGVETKPMYDILRNALMRMPEDAPLRGPKEYREGGFVYRNAWQGDVSRYSGEEQILQNGTPAYQASYFGGLVDQRAGT